MKKDALLLMLSLLTHFVIGQSLYDVDIKSENLEGEKLESKGRREAFGKCKFLYTFQFKEGDRFIFEKSETAIKEGWNMEWYFLTQEIKKSDYSRTKLLNKDYAGKIVKIIKIEEKKASYPLIPISHLRLRRQENKYLCRQCSQENIRKNNLTVAKNKFIHFHI